MRPYLVLLVAACATPTGHPSGGGDDRSGGKTDGTETSLDASPEGTAPDAADEPATIWKPTPGTTWQWQLTGTIDTTIDAAMYDIDLFDAPQAKIDQLHADGRVVICYFSAGSREDWRPDAAMFPAASLGSPLDGWPGERWIDTRSTAVRAIMKVRLDRAVARRCDGVEPDNVDGYANNNGLGLTSANQLDYNRFLATEAHARHLSVGLKNDLDQIPALVSSFDWALDEQCFELSECDTLTPFIAAHKAVFQTEYTGSHSAICADSHARHHSTLIKNLDLGAPRTACN